MNDAIKLTKTWNIRCLGTAAQLLISLWRSYFHSAWVCMIMNMVHMNETRSLVRWGTLDVLWSLLGHIGFELRVEYIRFVFFSPKVSVPKYVLEQPESLNFDVNKFQGPL